MKSVFTQRPCDTCNADQQTGNPYRWQCECDRCTKIGQWRNEALKRLSEIEDILGDTYDLDRLRELVQADREGRCVVLPCKAGDTFYRGDEKYKADHWNVVLTAIFWAGERKNITLLYPEEVGKVLEEMEDK